MSDSVANAPSSGEPKQTSLYDSTTDIDAEDDGQKRLGFYGQSAVDSSSKSAIDVSTPIIYHYLTFETSIPSPTSNISATGSSESAPMPPELKKYTSPFDWPESRKQCTLFLSCMATFATAYTAGAYSPATKQMMELWQVSEVAILVGITTFCAGFAIAPMALAPFSELNGRKPIFVAAGALFFITQICCAVTRSYPGMLVARFFVGCGSSVFSTMVGGVISDIHHKEARNTPMVNRSLYSNVRRRISSANLTAGLVLWFSAFRYWLRPIDQWFYCAEHILAMGVLAAGHHKWALASCK